MKKWIALSILWLLLANCAGSTLDPYPPTGSDPGQNKKPTLAPTTWLEPLHTQVPLAIHQPSPTSLPIKTKPLPTTTPTPSAAITPRVTDLPFLTKQPIILYHSFPGDGAGCMADYLGWTAPLFVLYADGQLLKHNPREDPWYSETFLNPQQVAALIGQIEDTGFFDVTGDGRQYENDSIYNFPDNYDQGRGAGTQFISIHEGNLTKQVYIYDLWVDYLVPEVARPLQLLWDYTPVGIEAYSPADWVAWVENVDPCEPYQLEYLPWPKEAPDISLLMSGANGAQLVFHNSKENEYNHWWGDKPGTYLYDENGVRYYILIRPLLPHELPSDFLNY